MEKLTVALLQVASSTTPADNRARLPELAERAGDSRLVVLPEAYARDFGRPGERLAGEAEPLDGPFVSALVDVATAQGGTWVAGMVESGPDPERPYNTLVVADRSGLLAAYRKIHLYDSFGFKESDVIAAGDPEPVVVPVDGWSVGLLTCYDLRFPELSRALSRRGTDLQLVPAAWVAGPRKVRHWETLLTARAVENLCFVAGAGQPGPRYTGHSLVADPRGDVVVTAGQDEAVLSVTLDPEAVTEAREENPSLLNRRDDGSWWADS